MRDLSEAYIPIIILLLMVALPIFLIFFFASKIKMKDATAKKIETYGYCLLFISLAWQLVVKDILMKSFDLDAEIYFINEKLYAMFLYLKHIANTSSANTKAADEIFSKAYFEGIGDFARVQVELTNIISVILAIISTLLVSVGRLHEISIKKDEDKPLSIKPELPPNETEISCSTKQCYFFRKTREKGAKKSEINEGG